MAPFPLFSLPFVAFREIVLQMKMIEFFRLSLVSKETFAKLKSAKRKIKYMLLLCDFAQAILIQEHQTEAANLSIIYEDRFMDNIEQLKINNSVINIWSIEENGYNCDRECFKASVIPILTHFSELFVRFQFILSVDSCYIEYSEDVLQDSFFRNCAFVKISGVFSLKPMGFHLFTENCRPKRGIKITCEFRCELDLEKIQNLPEISINWATSIKIDDIMRLDSEFIMLTKQNLSEENLNTFLKYWLSGGAPKLKRMCLGLDDERALAFNIEHVLMGIPFMKYDRKNRAQHFKSERFDVVEYVNCEKGMDIKRDDGTIATIVLVSNNIEFVVWQ